MADETEQDVPAPTEAQAPEAAKEPKPPKAPKAPKAKKAPKQAPKKKGVKGATADDASLPSIARHPRAGAQIARMKSWGGLVGFGLVAVLSWRAHVPGPDLLLRAIVGGVVGYVATWAGAVAVWRHLVIAELRAVRAHRMAVAQRRRAAGG